MKTGWMLSLCLALVSAQTAGAECVDADDLWTGIAVEYDSGPTHRYQRANEDMVELVIEGPGFTLTTELIHGLYVVRSAVSGGQSLVNTRAYDTANPDLHVPDGPHIWTYEAIHAAPATDSAPPTAVNEQVEFQAFESEELRLGDCLYTYIPVHQRTTRGPNVIERRLGYIPSIGTVLTFEQVRNGVSSGGRTPAGIRAVE